MSSPAQASPPAASFEIQIHPAGCRSRVRYFRLSRAHLTFWSILGLVYLLLLTIAAGLAPGVVAGLFGGEEYRALAAERMRQGERLLALAARLEELRDGSATQLLQVRKVSAAYDIPAVPAAAAAPPAAHAAGARAGGAGTAAPPVESIYDGAVQQGNRLQARIRRQIGALEVGLAAIGEFERAHPDQVRETPAACPLRGDRYVLTNPFGRQRSAFTRDFGFHAGIDLAAPRGTPIQAPADGVVVFAGTYPLRRSPVWWRYGTLVAVAHGERYLTLYGHCAEVKVAAGQAVRRGEVLATTGSSGWSLGPHLHYEVRKRGAGGVLLPVDPLIFILDRHWPNEERLLAAAGGTGYAAGASESEPLPPELDRPPGARGAGRAGHRGGRRSPTRRLP